MTDGQDKQRELSLEALDRVSGGDLTKVMAAPSNLRKKIDDTAEPITQNIK